MTAQVEHAKRFAEVLKAGKPELRDLLTEDVAFLAFNNEIRGRDAVLARLTGEGTGRTYREATWIDAKLHGDAVQITARMPEEAPSSGNILLLRFRGAQVATIQQQLRLPGKPLPATVLKLPPDLKDLVNNALATRHPMLLSHVDETGQPVLSFRGSTQAFSDDQLAIWIRNQGGGFLRSITKNPKVALMYRDEDRKATYQFQGRARVTTDAADRRAIYDASNKAERDHDFVEAGVAVIIDLDRVEGYAGLTPSGPVGRVHMKR
jgi:predicted pyridoxine 5'-phosphate oxidase superfamily flavin-nucleotide-binding protein